ncbi:hypothetical protein C0Q70_21517 [Pomacea canaliculata]|uniref:Uncharacterized protein n=1 Tax=Pomacea canaliculata TaxID=400727 RepID=A0A2T7NCR1_POMCA|nr:hypothetical protein C0Q70_21517 [Pomacea canaliculata]
MEHRLLDAAWAAISVEDTEKDHHGGRFDCVTTVEETGTSAVITVEETETCVVTTVEETVVAVTVEEAWTWLSLRFCSGNGTVWSCGWGRLASGSSFCVREQVNLNRQGRRRRRRRRQRRMRQNRHRPAHNNVNNEIEIRPQNADAVGAFGDDGGEMNPALITINGWLRSVPQQELPVIEHRLLEDAWAALSVYMPG